MRDLRILVTGLILTAVTISAEAQDPDFFQAAGTPVNPKVAVSWNRYNTYSGIESICRQLARAHPNLIKMNSIGKSFQGRDMWMLTVTNFREGEEMEKPGFYIDGNIHSNEIQGAEISLYTAWYLAEMYSSNKFIQDLLDEKVFYILPSLNPDARNNYMLEANTASSPRSGMMPIDDDRDGLKDEDGYDDLNNDGHITFMRRKNPNGRYVEDRRDPRRLVQVEAEQTGEYELLGYEGLDNDGDGRVNEDRVGGYYDPNRDWAWNWQPDYIQGGAYKYPFSVPENRTVADFFMSHPNIAGAQSYHNTGGMLLRGPGSEEDIATYGRSDIAVYDQLGNMGEKLIPGYRYLVLYKDLYSTFGGEIEWFHGGRGVFSFTNELYTSYLMFHNREGGQEAAYDFDKYLLFEDAYVEWEEYDHPQYGLVEIGGQKKNFRRANPGFLLETDAHRNMAFTLYHAYHTPKLEFDKVEIKKLGGGIREVTATVANRRIIPTHSGQDLKYKITRPDFVTLTGPDVIAGMEVINLDLNQLKEQKHSPQIMEVSNIPGMGTVTIRWIVSGNDKVAIEINSAKGGVARWTEE